MSIESADSPDVIALLNSAFESLVRLDNEVGPRAVESLLSWWKTEGVLPPDLAMEGKAVATEVVALISATIDQITTANAGGCDSVLMWLREVRLNVNQWAYSIEPSRRPIARDSATVGIQLILKANRKVKKVIKNVGATIGCYKYGMMRAPEYARYGYVTDVCDSEADCADEEPSDSTDALVEAEPNFESEAHQPDGDGDSQGVGLRAVQRSPDVALQQAESFGGADPQNANSPNALMWAKARRKLFYKNEIIRDYRKRGAPNQEKILDQFQTENWCEGVSIDAVKGLNPTQAAEAIASFNKTVKPGTIKLCMDGTGRGVLWRVDA